MFLFLFHYSLLYAHTRFSVLLQFGYYYMNRQCFDPPTMSVLFNSVFVPPFLFFSLICSVNEKKYNDAIVAYTAALRLCGPAWPVHILPSTATTTDINCSTTTACSSCCSTSSSSRSCRSSSSYSSSSYSSSVAGCVGVVEVSPANKNVVDCTPNKETNNHAENGNCAAAGMVHEATAFPNSQQQQQSDASTLAKPAAVHLDRQIAALRAPILCNRSLALTKRNGENDTYQAEADALEALSYDVTCKKAAYRLMEAYKSRRELLSQMRSKTELSRTLFVLERLGRLFQKKDSTGTATQNGGGVCLAGEQQVVHKYEWRPPLIHL